MRSGFYTFIFFIFFLHSAFISEAQNQHTIDSLQTVFKTTTEDTTKVSALYGISYEYQGFNSDKAFDFANQSLQLAQSINFKRGQGNAHNMLGDLYWYKGDYASASDHYFKALNIFEALGNRSAIANCYRNIGWVYYTQNNYPVTLEYYNKSLAINTELKNTLPMAQNYNDLGIVYTHMENYPKAIEYIQHSIAVEEDAKNIEGLIANYGNLGVIYDRQGKIDQAIEAIEKAAKNAEILGNKQHLAITYSNLGSFYTKKEMYDLAIAKLYKALAFGKEIKFKDAIKDIYQNLAIAYAKKKDFQNAYLYNDSASSMKDSVFNENNSRQVNEMSAKYESEKKELMISSLEKDKEREQSFKIYLSIICVLIAVFAIAIGIFAFVLYKGNIQKKKANEALSHAYKEIEVKNKDITDSINYSKRIQDASLPPKELLYNLFSDAFVLFKPKDIVSGDFYWYAEKDGKRLIAACDCTGHGVPGALMSMIGTNILNQLVNEKGITSADEILNRLHLEVRKALKQDEHQKNADGMDIALVVFNSETEIEFAGAQRPLWCIKNNVVEEIKPDKFSIGGLQTEESRIFKKTKIMLSKGDSLYLFSDGYVDQFGGEHGKKFMTKNFKNLLLDIHRESMSKQELMVDQTIERWKSNREQVDDILVIGIKI